MEKTTERTNNMAQNIYQFLLEPGLQELYRDKDTGLPLSNGQIIFFKDKARTELKPVYELILFMYPFPIP
jgi:hypothetical protein